jgi:3-hydroxyisobutyrate dehydrogenase
MIGGDPALIERCRPVLGALGSQLFIAGALGAGHAIKCLNNYVSAAGLLAAAEGLVAAQRFGLDPKVALEVINASTGKNNSTEHKFAQFVFSRSFGSGFSIGLMAKDLRTALELAAQVKAPMPLGSHCVPLWNDAESALGANADHTEIVRSLAHRPPAIDGECRAGDVRGRVRAKIKSERSHLVRGHRPPARLPDRDELPRLPHAQPIAS